MGGAGHCDRTARGVPSASAGAARQFIKPRAGCPAPAAGSASARTDRTPRSASACAAARRCRRTAATGAASTHRERTGGAAILPHTDQRRQLARVGLPRLAGDESHSAGPAGRKLGTPQPRVRAGSRCTRASTRAGRPMGGSLRCVEARNPAGHLGGDRRPRGRRPAASLHSDSGRAARAVAGR